MRNDGEEPRWSWKGTAEEEAEPIKIHGIHDQIFKEYKVFFEKETIVSQEQFLYLLPKSVPSLYY